MLKKNLGKQWMYGNNKQDVTSLAKANALDKITVYFQTKNCVPQKNRESESFLAQ